MACPHNNRIGDNYGETCADCGQVLGGHGYWAEGNQSRCHHSFALAYPGATYEECLYCGEQRTVVRGN